jgi:predicted P-loop ATPase
LKNHAFHPVIDYLSSLKHDGKARSGTWLATCLGAEQTAYNETVGRAMLIAAVARIFQPGCKVDTVPIFEGAQGARKSTAVKALFDPWFSDELADLGSKDAAMQTRGVWASRCPSWTRCRGWRFRGSRHSSPAPLTDSGRLWEPHH